jgi:formiminotetrahydrofolate cyclodeaminase
MKTRGEERQTALTEAAAVPLEGMRIALDALHLSANALALGNVNLVSDAGCAAEFAHAGLLGCAYNVRVNHRFMRDAEKVAAQRATLEGYEREATSLTASLRKAVNEALTR